MAFQFMCPQGHVLEGDESHAGQTIQCPLCSTTFIIPSPQLGAAPSGPQIGPAQDEPDFHVGRRGGRFGFLEADQGGADESQSVPDILSAGPTTAFDPSGEGSEHRLVTIPCPNGHPLTTPYSTMGDEVLCPHCGEQFTLAYTDSLEYKRDVELKQAIRDQKLGKTWLTWAVVAAVVVVALVLGLIIAASQ
jgi:ribosomal protein S27E